MAHRTQVARDLTRVAGLGQVIAGRPPRESSHLTPLTGQWLRELDELTRELDELPHGADHLTRGANDLTHGAGDLTRGSDDLTRGANELTRGANELTRGSVDLTRGSNELTRGADDLTRGSAHLTRGSDDLTRGSAHLTRGATVLILGPTDLNRESVALARGPSHLVSHRLRQHRPARQRSLFSSAPAPSNLDLQAKRFRDCPSLASMLELNAGDVRSDPDQVVIRFPTPILPHQLRREKAASLAEVGLLVQRIHELVGDAKTAPDANPQSALLKGLANRGLFRRLARLLSATGQEIAAGRRGNRDRGTRPLDNYIAAGAERILDPTDGDTEFQDRGRQ